MIYSFFGAIFVDPLEMFRVLVPVGLEFGKASFGFSQGCNFKLLQKIEANDILNIFYALFLHHEIWVKHPFWDDKPIGSASFSHCAGSASAWFLAPMSHENSPRLPSASDSASEASFLGLAADACVGAAGGPWDGFLKHGTLGCRASRVRVPLKVGWFDTSNGWTWDILRHFFVFWSQKMLVCVLEVCVLQLVGQGPVAQKYMREAGRGGWKAKHWHDGNQIPKSMGISGS